MFCINCGNEIKDGSIFCTKCGGELVKSQKNKPKSKRPSKRKLLFVFTGLFIFTIGLYLLITIFYTPNNKNIDYDIASSVVNIYCEGEGEEESIGGSGTIFSEDGLVLTNAHIIPESAKDDIYIDDTLCLVILPDPYTGAPKEIYHAYPILDENFSDEYDIAFLQIHDVYYNEEEGKAYGEYPKKFPAYADKKRCGSDSVKLGEPIKVYGYPAISGGNALTITDGVVSSLLVDEGLIITSAKISYGNSGGLAVDQNGCMIGIPSMVTGDENESLGVIISNDLINEFIGKIQ
ncbi:trypsin-like peptidase domain-containing protein [Patescibacteria group bacterium]|nr:trypsin-like peptidase domain-containing protein [Patescibacteria group bacterium]MBU4275068.1 trypsin-like peptidase domain-containing protein [Patescibacteria group bacterium]MCG2699933.1 trypsin-like peptidase domain-containing protein [Candidatus Parcubacteria bacterium]